VPDEDVELAAGRATVLATVLTMDPSVLVTGSVTPWTVSVTPDVSPEISVGWPVVAAWACPAGTHMTR
jgi:hypothetical protein